MADDTSAGGRGAGGHARRRTRGRPRPRGIPENVRGTPEPRNGPRPRATAETATSERSPCAVASARNKRYL